MSVSLNINYSTYWQRHETGGTHQKPVLTAQQQRIYVNPQMGTNSVLERGVPKWEFLSLPACFHMGTPHMEMGTVVLASHWVTHQAPLHHQKFWLLKMFSYGDPHLETGIDTTPYGNGESPFPYGDKKNESPFPYTRGSVTPVFYNIVVYNTQKNQRKVKQIFWVYCFFPGNSCFFPGIDAVL